MRVVSRKNAEHYNWKDVCDGWHFLQSEETIEFIVVSMPKSHVDKENLI